MGTWHKCTDELPNKDGTYLVCRFFNHKYIDKYIDTVEFTMNPYTVDKYDFEEYKGKKKNSIFYGYDSEWGHYEIDNVTHWMELPALPED